MGNAEKTEKKTEKKARKKSDKPRKQRAVMRSRKESFAGHCADRLAANVKQRADIMKLVTKAFNPAGEEVEAVIARLNGLAAAGFAPERKRGGRTAVTFTPGQRVTLSQEARDMLRPQIADIDTAHCFVATSYNPTATMKQVPVRADVADLNGRWVGFVSKGFVNAS